jgi:hypothetical protein
MYKLVVTNSVAIMLLANFLTYRIKYKTKAKAVSKVKFIYQMFYKTASFERVVFCHDVCPSISLCQSVCLSVASREFDNIWNDLRSTYLIWETNIETCQQHVILRFIDY